MNIHMSLNQYNKLINLCKKSKTEQSGFMTVTEIDNDFNINKIELVSEDLIDFLRNSIKVQNCKENR